MEMKQEMVTLSKVHDAYSGVCLMDTTSTVVNGLNKSEAVRYAKAMMKVGNSVTLNRKDLALFDKIDVLTFEAHGMCLKDSRVTKARLKACKKQRIEFIDRDGLMDHMNLMFPEQDEELRKISFYQAFGEFLASQIGVDAMYELHDLIHRIEGGGELTLADLELLSKLEQVVSDELDWTIINQDIKSAVDRASKNLGIYFPNLQQVTTH